MMENTTTNNLDKMIKRMKDSLSFGVVEEVKTLSDVYRRTLNSYMDYSKNNSVLVEQANELKSIIKNIEKHVIPNGLEMGKYKEIHGYTVALERLKSSASMIENVQMEYEKKTKREIQKVLDKSKTNCDSVSSNKKHQAGKAMQLLEHSINHNYLITLFNDDYRGIGKTTALVQKAHELDAILIVKYENELKRAEEIAVQLGLIVSIVTTKNLRNLRGDRKLRENGYLIDETVDLSILKELTGYKLLGGFSYSRI